MATFKRILLYVWLAAVVAIFGFYLANPGFFSPENLSELMNEYEGPILLTYSIACLIRGFFLIPSTPFIFTGALLFPDKFWLVLGVSMAGILASAAFAYYFSEFLELDKLVERRFKKQFEKLHRAMEKRGFVIVIAWSFFPLVPTDIISYTAGILRMKFWKFMLALTIGELPLVLIYLLTGKALLEWLF